MLTSSGGLLEPDWNCDNSVGFVAGFVEEEEADSARFEQEDNRMWH